MLLFLVFLETWGFAIPRLVHEGNGYASLPPAPDYYNNNLGGIKIDKEKNTLCVCVSVSVSVSVCVCVCMCMCVCVCVCVCV